jgi:hypothetical protein
MKGTLGYFFLAGEVQHGEDVHCSWLVSSTGGTVREVMRFSFARLKRDETMERGIPGLQPGPVIPISGLTPLDATNFAEAME